ncbi:hypothetical protein [Marivirga harenae]|uniref:hypothetical protein n=1 Tax=Marivirga harenae TaxID=2010992 RepID=UPI0026DF84B1|nr:hypothetical protein [Marivirga harenae]WKV11319.1 hypothetical protein Q3Y49_14005 [Marivirga harenae]|tara:strand:- start:64084 stop:64830 length:747 start_codon:yes stop_codon:yes gene_type:complete
MKILKWIFIVLVAIGLLGFLGYLIVDEDLPQGQNSEKAEQLADKMLEAVNDSAWQEIAIVEWVFAGQHHLVWDKDRHWAKVSWENYDVFIKLDSKKGIAFAKGKKIERDELLNSLLEEAYAIWANDSFWLNPITKIKDDGTDRSYIPQENNSLEGLLVTYKSGGVTPGDSYLWLVNEETGIPEYVKMWVAVIPVGGVKFSWENWHTTIGGAKIAQTHESIFTIEISELATWNTLEAYPNIQEFKVLEN